MRKSMDIFGKALYAHWTGDRTKFYIVDSTGKIQVSTDLRRYFRNYEQLTRLEKRLISLATGNILDVGCATGYYIPALMRKGKVVGIDISKHAILMARERGLRNCRVADIFHFHTKQRFDTITLMENNLGMAETINGIKKLLRILSNLLSKKGQILTISRKRKKDYTIATLWPVFKNQKGARFKWISLSRDYLSKLCKEIGLNVETLDKDRYNYLIKITKK